MSYEDRNLEFGDRTSNEEFNRKIIKAWDALKPKLKDFGSLYEAKTIAEDLAEIKRIKNSETYRRAKTEAAIVAEYALPHLIEDEQILGADASVTSTSEFDDIKRGVDFVIRFTVEDEEEEFMIGIDVKTNEQGTDSDSGVRDALNRLKENARRGTMREIKYFIDPQTEKRGSVAVPALILVFSNEVMLKLKDILAKTAATRTSDERATIQLLRKAIKGELKQSAMEMIRELKTHFTRVKDPDREVMINVYSKFIQYLDQQ